MLSRFVNIGKRSSVSGAFYLCQSAGFDVVYEAPNRDLFGNPGMRLDGSHLLPDIFFEVVKRIKARGRIGLRSHLFDEAILEFVFANSQEAAIGVIDDDELLRIEQVMRDYQRADRVFCSNASCVADHVRVAGTKSETVFEQDA